MKIGIITTSRADFGIYLPFLRKVKDDPNIEYFLFVGGMHTSADFGEYWRYIEEQSFAISEKLHPLSLKNAPTDISVSMGETIISYAKVWEKYNFLDVVFCLGDRFEMFAAVSSLVPFNIPIAHFSGGEVTLGAIDNKFRNAITMLSTLHFASTEQYAENIRNMIGKDTNQMVYNVGSLGTEAALASPLMSENEFEKKYGINTSKGFVLTTYHPETVGLNNSANVKELIKALNEIPLKIIITLPNADTEGNLIREELLKFEKEKPNKVSCFENLGQQGYYSAMKYCTLLLGNTSSGIVEAGAFGKRVINVGDRQKGRIAGDNVIHVANSADSIINAYHSILLNKKQGFYNPYQLAKESTSSKIIEILMDYTNHPNL